MPLNKRDFDRIIAKEGRSVVLFRKGTPDRSVTIKAKTRQVRNSPETADLGGGMLEEVIMVICSTVEMVAASFPSPPVNTDRVQFDGEYHLIKVVYPLYLATVLVGYRIQVQG